ncbi:MAG: thioredoxin [Bacteroidetes bacterium]|nr:thioredoxin [Bacteroidota bacterium]
MQRIRLFTFISVSILLLNCSGNGTAGKGDPGKAGSVANAPIQMTKADFIQKVFDYEKNKEWKYKGDVPCIIDFYANWCKPCKMISPYLEEIASTYAGKLRVYKINIDEEKELANAFQIESIPAVLFVPLNGQPQMSVGALPKEEYEKVVTTTLLVNKQ